MKTKLFNGRGGTVSNDLRLFAQPVGEMAEPIRLTLPIDTTVDRLRSDWAEREPVSALLVDQGKPVAVFPSEWASLLQYLPPTLPVRAASLPTRCVTKTLPLETVLREHAPGHAVAYVAVDDAGQPAGILTPDRLFRALRDGVMALSALVDALAETTSDAVTVVDASGRVLLWNRAAEAIYRIPKRDIIGQPIASFFPTGAIKVLEQLERRVPVRRLYHVPRPDRHVVIDAAPVERDGKLLGAVAFEEDISDLVRLRNELSTAQSHLRTLQEAITHARSDDPFAAIRGRSPLVKRVVAMARKVAATDVTVLITGESGVGKELFAQALHRASRRAKGPFVALNCAAIPVTLFESELFGYHAGAFTGAERSGRPGKLELARGGTLFLDEIGELPLELQAKLLRVLQERQFYRIGGTKPLPLEARIIAATNRRLDEEVAAGRFRADLYYRLNVVTLEIPPLRERPEDIPELVQAFLFECASRYDKPVPVLTPEALAALMRYPWPGNVRQLRNAVERAIILMDGNTLDVHHFPEVMGHTTDRDGKGNGTHPGSAPRPGDEKTSAAGTQPTRDEAARILTALRTTYGNKSAAARLLGISRGTLYNRLKALGLSEADWKGEQRLDSRAKTNPHHEGRA